MFSCDVITVSVCSVCFCLDVKVLDPLYPIRCTPDSLLYFYIALSPLLTWRDVQHIIVKTSRRGHLSAPDWQTNGAGHDGIVQPTHLFSKNFVIVQIPIEEPIRADLSCLVPQDSQ